MRRVIRKSNEFRISVHVTKNRRERRRKSAKETIGYSSGEREYTKAIYKEHTIFCTRYGFFLYTVRKVGEGYLQEITRQNDPLTSPTEYPDDPIKTTYDPRLGHPRCLLRRQDFFC